MKSNIEKKDKRLFAEHFVGLSQAEINVENLGLVSKSSRDVAKVYGVAVGDEIPDLKNSLNGYLFIYFRYRRILRDQISQVRHLYAEVKKEMLHKIGQRALFELEAAAANEWITQKSKFLEAQKVPYDLVDLAKSDESSSILSPYYSC